MQPASLNASERVQPARMLEIHVTNVNSESDSEHFLNRNQNQKRNIKVHVLKHLAWGVINISGDDYIHALLCL